jgi:hypothetical protein
MARILVLRNVIEECMCECVYLFAVCGTIVSYQPTAFIDFRLKDLVFIGGEG